MSTIFTKIIEGELPATFVWKDDKCVAFMSINPLKTGHTLVVPIKEVDHWLDAELDLQLHLFEVAQQIGKAQMAAFSPARIGLVIAGFEVPHLHLHVVPINSLVEMDMSHTPPMVDSDQLQEPADEITMQLALLELN